MNRWKVWRYWMNKARAWDSLEAGDDKEITSLKGMFKSAKRDAPDIGVEGWRNIRPHLKALGETTLAPPISLWNALASTGPRFAVGAACALLIMAGAFMYRAEEAPRIETAALSPPPVIVETQAASPEEYPVQALQSNNGEELLQFIAYGGPSR